MKSTLTLLPEVPAPSQFPSLWKWSDTHEQDRWFIVLKTSRNVGTIVAIGPRTVRKLGEHDTCFGHSDSDGSWTRVRGNVMLEQD